MTMPAAAGGFVIKDALVTMSLSGVVPEVEYTNQLDTATFTPDQSTQTKRTLVPDGTLQDVDSSTWSLTLAGIQDYVAARGIARFLFDNEGQKADVTVQPIKTGGVGMKATVTLKAVPFGGETGSWAEFSVELPADGKPEIVDPV